MGNADYNQVVGYTEIPMEKLTDEIFRTMR